jgi:hypothetical protein
MSVFAGRLMHVKVAHLLSVTIRPDGNARPKGSIQMLDLIMLAIGLGFFALSIGYAYACDRL